MKSGRLGVETSTESLLGRDGQRRPTRWTTFTRKDVEMARDDYETRRERQHQGVQLAKAAGKYAGRQPDRKTHERIVALREAGHTIKRTAELAGCSASQVKRIWALHRS